MSHDLELRSHRAHPLVRAPMAQSQLPAGGEPPAAGTPARRPGPRGPGAGRLFPCAGWALSACCQPPVLSWWLQVVEPAGQAFAKAAAGPAHGQCWRAGLVPWLPCGAGQAFEKAAALACAQPLDVSAGPQRGGCLRGWGARERAPGPAWSVPFLQFPAGGLQTWASGRWRKDVVPTGPRGLGSRAAEGRSDWPRRPQRQGLRE